MVVEAPAGTEGMRTQMRAPAPLFHDAIPWTRSTRPARSGVDANRTSEPSALASPKSSKAMLPVSRTRMA